MLPTPSAPKPHGPRRWAGLGTACLLLGLVSCSGGGDPVRVDAQPVAQDTYFRARVTVLDNQTSPGGVPCVPSSCPPEFYDCGTLQPVVAGTTWDMAATLASAGAFGCYEPSAGAPENCGITISATDTASRIGIELLMRVNDVSSPAGSTAMTVDPLTGEEAIFVDVYLPCSRVNGEGDRESHAMVLGQAQASYPAGWANEATITVFPQVGGVHQPAVRVGTTFQPAGIVEGTFRFVGQLKQEATPNDIIGHVGVEGCFRLNLPDPTAGIPVDPAAGGACP